VWPEDEETFVMWGTFVISKFFGMKTALLVVQMVLIRGVPRGGQCPWFRITGDAEKSQQCRKYFLPLAYGEVALCHAPPLDPKNKKMYKQYSAVA